MASSAELTLRQVGLRTALLARRLGWLVSAQRQLWMGVHRDVRGIPRVRATLEFLAALFAQLRGALRP